MRRLKMYVRKELKAAIIVLGGRLYVYLQEQLKNSYSLLSYNHKVHSVAYNYISSSV